MSLYSMYENADERKDRCPHSNCKYLVIMKVKAIDVKGIFVKIK